MKNIPRWVWMAAFTIAVGITAWAVTYHPGKNPVADPPAAGPPRAVPVEAAPAHRGKVALAVDAVGSLDAEESVVIRSEIAGRISAILFSEGQPIAEGEALVQIDPSEYVAQLKQIKAAVELNQLNFERAQRLHEEKMISPQGYDEIAAKLKESQANLSLSQARLDKTTIRAPFSGRLGLRQVSPGDYVQMGQAIVNLEDIDSIKVDFRIPEIYGGQVKPDQTVAVRVDAFPTQTFSGQIYAIDPRIDAATRTLLLRARIPNTSGRLRPGMFARVTLLLGERPDAVWVPEQALVPMGEAKFVFRIVSGKAAMTHVTVGQRRGGEVEILEGLRAGNTVVTAGQGRLADGMPVMILNTSGGKPRPPASTRPSP